MSTRDPFRLVETIVCAICSKVLISVRFGLGTYVQLKNCECRLRALSGRPLVTEEIKIFRKMLFYQPLHIMVRERLPHQIRRYRFVYVRQLSHMCG